MRPTRAQCIGSVPVFLLEIQWSGKTYMISTKPISLPSSYGDQHFDGGLLEDPDILFQLPDLGFSVDSYSVPIACILKGVNISQEILSGNTLQRANAELSYVLLSNSTLPQYEERIQVIKGIIKQPVFGHPNRSNNYVEFSIETESIESSLYGIVVGSGSRLNATEISDQVNAALSPFSAIFAAGTSKIDVSEIHNGKQLPIVFGEAGSIYDDLNTLDYYGATPCYVLHVNGCLLYTSPSPRDGLLSRMPSSA